MKYRTCVFINFPLDGKSCLSLICLHSCCLCSMTLPLPTSLPSACLISPPDAGEDTVRENLTDNAFGTELTYTCSEGFYIQPDQVSLTPTSR